MLRSLRSPPTLPAPARRPPPPNPQQHRHWQVGRWSTSRAQFCWRYRGTCRRCGGRPGARLCRSPSACLPGGGCTTGFGIEFRFNHAFSVQSRASFRALRGSVDPRKGMAARPALRRQSGRFDFHALWDLTERLRPRLVENRRVSMEIGAWIAWKTWAIVGGRFEILCQAFPSRPPNCTLKRCILVERAGQI